MKNKKLFIPYSNDIDIKNIFNILEYQSNFYKFDNNILSFTSIFCNEKISLYADIEFLTYHHNLSNYLNNILKETIYDAKDFYKINFSFNETILLNKIIKHFKNNLEKEGLLNSIFSLYFLILNYDETNELPIFSCIFINNLLLFFGYYIKWNLFFENSFIGFWSELLILSFKEKNNKIVKEKVIKHFLNHTRIYFMEPIFFDNNKNNLNTNEENIFIKINVTKNKINFEELNNLYNEKNKKIDRTLISIYKNM